MQCFRDAISAAIGYKNNTTDFMDEIMKELEVSRERFFYNVFPGGWKEGFCFPYQRGKISAMMTRSVVKFVHMYDFMSAYICCVIPDWAINKLLRLRNEFPDDDQLELAFASVLSFSLSNWLSLQW